MEANMTFVIATGNKHKLEEIQRILAPLGVDVLSLAQAGVHSEVEETGTTFEQNAVLKALVVSRAADMPCIADDSGLEVDALNGAPGIYSARYAGEYATDDQRILKLLTALEGVPSEARTARFVCAICCIFPDGRSFIVKGECEGSIAFERSGQSGFGYDPVFIEESTGKTFAQLTDAEKDMLSHRGKALNAFKNKLKEYI
jgi:XTP/dITP diphosphohydrolase